MDLSASIASKWLLIRSTIRNLTPAWAQGIAAFLVLTFLMGVWVHWSFQGYWWGPFLPGAQFGVPELVDKEFSIFPTSHTGWDAQFYYYQANDPFALADTAEHLDNPAYRYQRIGSPLLALFVARICGQRSVSGLTYHLTQIAVVSLGYGFLVYWLRTKGHSSFWGLAWLASDGVVNALAFGMPDPVGDSLFAVAAVGFLTNKLKIYLPAAIMLPLVREAYAVICGLIFIATAVGWVGWGAAPGTGPIARLLGKWSPRVGKGKYATNWLSVGMVAIPCAIVVAWHLYVTQRFGISPSKAGGNVMLDYPMLGWWRGLEMAIERRQSFEVLLHYFAMSLIVVAISTMWEQRHTHLLAIICVPYLGLLCCMSRVAWEDYSGYMKAAGTVIIMLLLFLPKPAGNLRTAFLLFLIIEGAVMGYQRKKTLQFLPYSDPIENTTHSSVQGSLMTGRLTSFNARIELLNEELILQHCKSDYNGLWQPFHRRLGPTIKVRVTNTSDVTWEALPKTGMHAVNLSYQWLDAASERVALENLRIPLGTSMPPGSSREFEMPLAYPGPGNYHLHVSMIQEGHVWFHHIVPQYKLQVAIND